MTTRIREPWDAVGPLYAHLSPQAQAVLRESYNAVEPADAPPRREVVAPTTKDLVLKTIQANKYATIQYVVDVTGINRRTVDWATRQLMDAGLVKRHRHNHGHAAYTYEAVTQ